MNIVLSCYPLSTDLVRSLRAHVVPDRAITLNSLRALPLKQLFRELRSQAGSRFSVVIGETTERTLLPILLMLASITPSRAIDIVDLPTGRVISVPRWRAFMSIGWSVFATVTGRAAQLMAEYRSRHLMRAKPLAFGPLESERGLYLKSNLMLGTQAGGSVGHIAGVVNELYKRCQDLLLLALEFPVTVDDAVHFEPIAPLKHYGVPPESNHLRFNGSCLRAAGRHMRQERFGYIYQRLSIANYAGVQLSRRYRVPLILEYNGSEVWISNNWGLKLAWSRLATRMEEVCFRHAHRIVVVSDVLAEELVSRGIPPEKIVNYPNCIDPDRFDLALFADERGRLRRELNIGEDEIVCTFLGTFGAWHGAEVLAEAINRYRQRAKPAGAPKLRFLMIGDGLLAGKCKEMLADAIQDGDAIFTGIVPQAQAPAYLAASDVFMSPHVNPTDGSRFFGSPTKLFEYMAMERPIVASALEQLATVLEPAIPVAAAKGAEAPGANLAILTEPGSVDDIVDALELLRDRPNWRETMGHAARRKVLAHYTWQKHVEQIFRSLDGNGGA